MFLARYPNIQEALINAGAVDYYYDFSSITESDDYYNCPNIS
jgi:hypothetical protein